MSALPCWQQLTNVGALRGIVAGVPVIWKRDLLTPRRTVKQSADPVKMTALVGAQEEIGTVMFMARDEYGWNRVLL